MNPTIGAELRPTRLRVSSRHVALSAILLIAAGLGCASKQDGAAAARSIALPFIENDYAKALQTARDANLPLFVEVWAPW